MFKSIKLVLSATYSWVKLNSEFLFTSILSYLILSLVSSFFYNSLFSFTYFSSNWYFLWKNICDVYFLSHCVFEDMLSICNEMQHVYHHACLMSYKDIVYHFKFIFCKTLRSIHYWLLLMLLLISWLLQLYFSFMCK